MSTHLLIAAAYLEDLPQGTKLVLMAIADSGDEHTLESAPGLPKMRAWSGLSHSHALAVVAKLAKPLEKGGLELIERVSAGRLGRRAVYRVFPRGVPAIPHPSEVAARYTDPSDPVDNPAEEGTAGQTLGSDLAPSRVLPAGPLHASTSVSSAQRSTQPVETGRSASGFPGSRDTAAEDRDARRRVKGALDVQCTIHTEQVVPCRRCTAAAAEPAAVRAAAEKARQLIRQNTTKETTT